MNFQFCKDFLHIFRLSPKSAFLTISGFIISAVLPTAQMSGRAFQLGFVEILLGKCQQYVSVTLPKYCLQIIGERNSKT